MKKARIIKCIAIFFVVSFCFSSLTATAIIEETISIPVPTDRSEDFYVTQAESIYIYNDLLNSFNTERTSISNTQTEKQEYPDYFGGAYINQETGGLVIKTTDVAQIKRSLRSSKRSLSSVTYELCDISYNQMRSVVNNITTDLDFFYEQNIEIVSVGIDVDTSKVYVKVVNLTDEKASIIKKRTNCSFLQFGNGNAIIPEVSIGGGYPATPNYNTSMSSTICCAATRANVDGFVISGHAGTTLGQEFTSLGNTLGPVTATAYYDNTTADAAFVAAVGNNIEVSNILYSGDILFNTYESELPDGARVHKYGRVTNLTSGYILQIGTTITHTDGTTITDCVVTTYNSSGGDSGCPVMFYGGSSNGVSQYSLCGIHSARETNGTDRYFSPYSNIVDELGIECITY